MGSMLNRILGVKKGDEIKVVWKAGKITKALTTLTIQQLTQQD